MSLLKSFYHFIGSLYFALALIASTALFAIVGTFLESSTDSHQYAARLTYENAFFSLLLWGYFLNILISALRRYPFKKHHIPFLLTHLGMLMMLAGVFVKTHFGVQGNMTILEGAGSDKIYLSHSYALYVQKKDSPVPELYTFKKHFPRYSPLQPVSPFFPNSLNITLLDYTPHSQESLDSWVKGNKLSFFGIKPLPIIQLPTHSQAEIPPFFQVSLPQSKEPLWNLLALKTEMIASVAEQVYIQSIQVTFRESASEKELFKVSLASLLKAPIETPKGPLATRLDFSWDSEKGFLSPSLHFQFVDNAKENIKIALDGEHALQNHYELPVLGKGTFEVELSTLPTLLFLTSSTEDLFIFAFNPHGYVVFTPSRSDQLDGMIAYDDGFLGYSREMKIPFMEEAENARDTVFLASLKSELQEGSQFPDQLAPPFRLVYQACQSCHQDFAEMSLAFLDQWNKQGGWLWMGSPPKKNLQEMLEAIDWQLLPSDTFSGIHRGCYWNAKLFERLDPLLKSSETDLIVLLKKLHWPEFLQMNLSTCPLEMWPQFLQAITLQLFATAHHLPEMTSAPSISSAQLLSAYFRAYGIHLSQIQRPPPLLGKPLILESMLTPRHKALAPKVKLEDNTPSIALRFSQGERQEEIVLSYDKTGSGLKWPIFDGEYVVRFQPLLQAIPYRLRLREARQINYANSQQPYSYESDLIVTDKNSQSITEQSISMNNVYETWDGYRFYLSNISPSNPGSVKRIQLVVNQDPAKYLMTYPGAIVMILGILGLFFKKKKDNKT